MMSRKCTPLSVQKSERPSVLVKLHAPLPQRDSHPKQNETEKGGSLNMEKEK